MKTNVPKQQPYQGEQNQVTGEPITEIESISKQPEKEEDVMERAPKISSVTLSTESVKAESTESSKVETPDAASTTSEMEKLEPLVVAADGPEGAAAKKATACPLTDRMLKLKKLHKSCIRKLPRRSFIDCSLLRYYWMSVP